MTRIIRRTQGDPVSAKSIDELKRLAELPDEMINTKDIPVRAFIRNAKRGLSIDTESAPKETVANAS